MISYTFDQHLIVLNKHKLVNQHCQGKVKKSLDVKWVDQNIWYMDKTHGQNSKQYS